MVSSSAASIACRRLPAPPSATVVTENVAGAKRSSRTSNVGRVRDFDRADLVGALAAPGLRPKRKTLHHESKERDMVPLLCATRKNASESEGVRSSREVLPENEDNLKRREICWSYGFSRPVFTP